MNSPLHPAPEWDVQIEVMQLPYLFRTHRDSIPAEVPYLNLPAEELTYISEVALRVQHHLSRIGLCFSCGHWNPTRAIQPQLFESIAHATPAHYYNLDQEPFDNPILTLHPEATWNESNNFGSGPLRLAAIIAGLDLVITVDTMVAHIAGALGKPVWLLLQHAADWRWMHNQTTSPWYPTMRIFRQSHAGNWTGVVEEVGRALEPHSRSILSDREHAYARLG